MLFIFLPSDVKHTLISRVIVFLDSMSFGAAWIELKVILLIFIPPGKRLFCDVGNIFVYFHPALIFKVSGSKCGFSHMVGTYKSSESSDRPPQPPAPALNRRCDKFKRRFPKRQTSPHSLTRREHPTSQMTHVCSVNLCKGHSATRR